LPTAKVVVEAASFDMQKIKIPAYPESATGKEIRWVSGMQGSMSCSETDMHAMAEKDARIIC
jgi:hypothetical protein